MARPVTRPGPPVTAVEDGDRLEQLLSWACTAPSEALVRWCELQALDGVEIAHPVLEIGPGNGRFAALAVGHVERAIEVDARNAERAAALPGVYDRVDLGDVRTVPIEPGSYATVFTNSVLSCVPDLPDVLERCAAALRPGGMLVATVVQPPVYTHLLSGHPSYVARRFRQQDMVTLWPVQRWLDALQGAGFADVATTPYLPAELGRLWDAIDAPAAIGRGRYRLGVAVKLAVDRLPAPMRRRYHRAWARALRSAAARRVGGPPCHVLLVARTPAVSP
jgi:SAM-dependent methyltransferase